MRTTALVIRESCYVRKVIARNPDVLFITIALPLLFLFVFAAISHGQHFHELGQPGKITIYTRLVASVIVMTVVSAAFADLAVFLVRDREEGVLKRLRSTPVPTGVFLGGHLVNAMLTSMVLALLVGALGWGVYGVSLPIGHVLTAVVTMLVGALACGALGFALTICVRTLNAAGAVVQAAVWTLFFSGNFFALNAMPVEFRALANVFPVRHFYEATLTVFNPNVTGSGFAPVHLGILVLWGAAGLAIAVWKCRWTPSAER
ncbi:MAG TPA: ABC transporter permease [Trebonia sp.]|nr:ABC transporter permease [Trebonia sp.]